MAKTRFTTPTMRMVQGDVDEPQTKDMDGNLRVVKSGPNAGQPNPQYFVAGAVQKNDPQWPAMWELLARQAFADFPTLFPHGVDAIVQAGGPQPWFSQPPAGHTMPWLMGDFSWKITDGDSSVISKGQLVDYSKRDGWAGCWVLKFGSAYPPRIFEAGQYAPNQQIQEKRFIRNGYYIRINGTTEGNGNLQKPGVYLNLDMVERAAIYTEIVTGPDAAAAFGAGPALPAGVTPTMGAAPAAPVPPTPVPAPTAPIPVAAAAPPVPVSPAPTSPVPAAAPPYAGYMGNATAPAPVAAPVPPTPAAPPPAPLATTVSPSSPVMLPAAQGATYEQMIAAGWTDETLRANGMMA